MAAKDFVEVRAAGSSVECRSICAQDTIQSNKITVFSKSYCPYCKRAKNLFATKYADAEIKVIECVSRQLDSLRSLSVPFRLDERDDGSEIQDYLAQKTGQRTVPNVFISA